MRTFLAIFLVLFLSLPTAMADSIDGKGIWCPDDDNLENSYGFWFQAKDSLAFMWHIYGFEIFSYSHYYTAYTRQIEIGSRSQYILNRTTLEMTYTNTDEKEILLQCFLTNSEQDLKQRLLAIVQKIKQENKI